MMKRPSKFDRIQAMKLAVTIAVTLSVAAAASQGDTENVAQGHSRQYSRSFLRQASQENSVSANFPIERDDLHGGDFVGADDTMFWERYLRRTEVTSMPTTKPTRRPSTSTPTRRPRPTRSPTDQPTRRPRPTLSPTDRPTRQPRAPTVNPTRTPPTDGPTLAPTPGINQPTVFPSVKPTLAPTEVPSTQPTRRPTRRPTQVPTERPTRRNTAPPTSSPTPETCEVDLATSCTNCAGKTFVNTECQGRPSQLFMRYTGGDCSQTSTTQSVPCFDFGPGPPTEPGTESFIEVSFDETIYFSGWVAVGSDYVIENSSGGLFRSPISILIFNSNNTVPDNLLQTLFFDADCSEPLFLKDQIGASQIVGFTVNDETTMAFLDANIALDVSVPSTSPAVELERLFSESNFGLFNLTNSTQGTVVNPGGLFLTSFDVTIDVTVPGNAEFLSTVLGRTSGGAQCGATDFFSFPYGPIDSPGLIESQGESNGDSNDRKSTSNVSPQKKMWTGKQRRRGDDRRHHAR